jgi:hypothetical protein
MNAGQRGRRIVASVKVRGIVFAVAVAVALGGGTGLLVGFAARHFGWPTGFVGPLTAGLVSALTIAIYRIRSGRADRSGQ